MGWHCPGRGASSWPLGAWTQTDRGKDSKAGKSSKGMGKRKQDKDTRLSKGFRPEEENKKICGHFDTQGDDDNLEDSVHLSRGIGKGSSSTISEDSNENDDLDDPAVVFACCDTDISGGLDVHELRFALNAFGLFPELDTIREWMRDEEAISLTEFQKLVEAKLAATPTSLRRPRAIPYSRRGVSFCQLASINRTFVESGWLEQECERFNFDNKDAIEAGQVHSLGQNLYALDRFLIRPVTSPEESGAKIPKELKDAAHLAEATHKVSFAELVNPKGVRVDYFVSHWWGHPFLDTMKALERWSKDVYEKLRKPTIDAVVYWLCFLALNQHRAGEEVGSTPEEGPFNAALVQARGAVMILDEAVRPFERIWCLYEVKRLTDLNKEFELICGLGQVGALLKGDASDDAKHAVALIGQALEKVSAFSAGASNIDDKFSIWHRVADPRFRNLPLDTLKANTLKKKGGGGGGPAFIDASFKRFDARIRGLLAAPLFQSALKEADPDIAVQFALKYISLGAPFKGTDLAILEQLGCNPCQLLVSVNRGRTLVDWTLLHCAAYFGHIAGLTYLVQHRANLDAKTRFGLTPLHLATSNGQVTAAEVLLKLGASINVQNKELRNELQGSALQGYDDCVDLLLRWAADPEMADKKGETVLHAAVNGGQFTVVERLLQHSVNLEATSERGFTPLHCAARDNHVEIAELLCDWSAQIGKQEQFQKKRCRRGASALDLAESKGHEPIASVLRRHFSASDVEAQAFSEACDVRLVEHLTEQSGTTNLSSSPPGSPNSPCSPYLPLQPGAEAKRQVWRGQKRIEKHFKF